MLVNKAVQLAVLAAAVLLDSRVEAASSPTLKFCGRQLSEIMSRVCHAYNSPWDTPTVVEQPGSLVRRRRQVRRGIADECCTHGCTWEQLSEYCSISAYTESPLEEMGAHIIADRSAEQGATESKGAAAAAAAPAADLVKSAARAAPVVGTVSPLITWGRTLNTDALTAGRDQYAYVVYT
ncbi:insulin-like growth factor II isoform X2 [Trichoplusia ni]|uniref:Insulin-like growth factor II isoform X2 n=1 Tax=Trichoplusia ni TaxID=7111 RepID=A0A7E5X1W8_TRINI|nr:insulin-like growth factor II isoform X2 [Trichoplusia ni]